MLVEIFSLRNVCMLFMTSEKLLRVRRIPPAWSRTPPDLPLEWRVGNRSEQETAARDGSARAGVGLQPIE